MAKLILTISGRDNKIVISGHVLDKKIVISGQDGYEKRFK